MCVCVCVFRITQDGAVNLVISGVSEHILSVFVSLCVPIRVPHTQCKLAHVPSHVVAAPNMGADKRRLSAQTGECVSNGERAHRRQSSPHIFWSVLCVVEDPHEAMKLECLYICFNLQYIL